MGKVKIKKSDIWIDMTPMSDVMTLLLTFFMLTSTFVKNEPVKVNTPGSVSEIKVPENGVLTILVSPEKDKAGNPTGEGQVFMSIDNTVERNTFSLEILWTLRSVHCQISTQVAHRYAEHTFALECLNLFWVQ